MVERIGQFGFFRALAHQSVGVFWETRRIQLRELRSYVFSISVFRAQTHSGPMIIVVMSRLRSRSGAAVTLEDIMVRSFHPALEA
jgi:hypothetical protein